MPYRFVISGGGTGGHIFPAIAIADQLKAMHPDASFLFVGANGKMEMEKVPKAGYEIVGLNITGIQRKLSAANLMFPFRLLSSLLKARSILKRFQPDVVIGVGGFASGPVLRMATWMNFPALIQEQNSFAGITNRWVAKDVDRACVAYDNMERFFPADRIVKTGNPVRREMVTIAGKREKALDAFGFATDKPVLLVIGGSLGARSINQAIKQDLDALLDAGLQVLWQTGKSFKDEAPIMRKQYAGQPVVIKEFIFDMDHAYAAADMVVSRAGAIAVSELCIVGKPTILVPFPFAAEDHQTKNAEALVKTKAAIMVTDKEVQLKLLREVLRLHQDEGLRKSLGENIKQHALPKAAEDIAHEVLKLVDQ